MKPLKTLTLSGLALVTVLMVSHGAYAAGLDTDADGIPDASEVLLGTDPMTPDTAGDGRNDLEDKAPVSLADPIVQGGAAAPFATSSHTRASSGSIGQKPPIWNNSSWAGSAPFRLSRVKARSASR